MSKWQPIETAPKDGTDILVYVSEAEECFVAFWSEHGVWRYSLKHHCTPTHWMPLPEPPEEK